MKQKQIDAIKLIEWFIPKGFNGVSVHNIEQENNIDGEEPEVAFIKFTSQGIKPIKVKDWKRYNCLVEGLKWMTTSEKMYRESFLEGTLLLDDFKNEPDYVKEMVQKIYNKIEKKDL